MNSNKFPFPKNFMSIPRNLCFFLIQWVHKNVQLSYQLSLCFSLHQRAILYYCEHTKRLYTASHIWCCLLCTYHMDSSRIHVILKSLYTGHTIIVKTLCNHINLSIVVGIVPLRHFPHAHSSYVLDSPCIWCPQIHLQF